MINLINKEAESSVSAARQLESEETAKGVDVQEISRCVTGPIMSVK